MKTLLAITRKRLTPTKPDPLILPSRQPEPFPPEVPTEAKPELDFDLELWNRQIAEAVAAEKKEKRKELQRLYNRRFKARHSGLPIPPTPREINRQAEAEALRIAADGYFDYDQPNLPTLPLPIIAPPRTP